MTWTLVTGGAKGVGRSICCILARAGYSIVVHYNTSKEQALDVASECRGYGVQAEIVQGSFSTPASTKEMMQRYLSQFGDTKNLINNVGNFPIVKALETDPEIALELFHTNVHAPFMLIQALSSSIKAHQGSIINIGTSGLHSFRANESAPVYTMTKMALWSLTKSLAKEFAPFCVRVNMVSPGQLTNSINLPQDCSRLPMKRPGTPEEVARVVSFLLDENTSYITGQNIEVAGGFNL